MNSHALSVQPQYHVHLLLLSAFFTFIASDLLRMTVLLLGLQRHTIHVSMASMHLQVVFFILISLTLASIVRLPQQLYSPSLNLSIPQIDFPDPYDYDRMIDDSRTGIEFYGYRDPLMDQKTAGLCFTSVSQEIREYFERGEGNVPMGTEARAWREIYDHDGRRDEYWLTLTPREEMTWYNLYILCVGGGYFLRRNSGKQFQFLVLVEAEDG